MTSETLLPSHPYEHCRHSQCPSSPSSKTKRQVLVTLLLGIGLVLCSFQVVLQRIDAQSAASERANEISNTPPALAQSTLRQSQTAQDEPDEPDGFPAFVPLLNRTVESPVPVVLYPYALKGEATGQAFQLAVDGIQQSPYMTLERSLYNFDPDVVWVVDESDGGYPLKAWCAQLTRYVRAAQNERKRRGLPTQWPIHFLQVYHDTPTMFRCAPVTRLVGLRNVQYSKRSIVVNRQWNEDTQYVDVGSTSLVRSTHTPIAVRTDIVQGVQDYLQQHQGGLDLTYPYERLDRPIDVAHYWPADGDDDGTKVSPRCAKLRFHVSNILKKFGQQEQLSTFVGLAGEAKETGRRDVNPEYIEGMMQAKIHVVTQRDNWEDHYRLFEALTSGALVMTDRMLSLPAGLQDGVSIIEYASVNDLKAKINFYLYHTEERLAIAARGKRIAMERHRSWHRMEEVIFGDRLSRCKDNSNAVACMFAVDHQTRREHRAAP